MGLPGCWNGLMKKDRKFGGDIKLKGVGGEFVRERQKVVLLFVISLLQLPLLGAINYIVISPEADEG